MLRHHSTPTTVSVPSGRFSLRTARWSLPVLLALLTSGAALSQQQFEEDVPDMPQSDLQLVMSWIKATATLAKSPFCYRQSHGRGVGEVPGRPADCPDGYTNNGLTCGRGGDSKSAPSMVATCPAGYTNTGFTCFRGADTYGKACDLIGNKHPCKEGYTDFGCTCTRGADSLGPSSMTCPAGYHQSDITKRCIVDCPAGYTNTGETCYKPVSTLGLDAMTCKPGEVKKGARCFPSANSAGGSCGPGRENDAGLCYPVCPAGFHGIGPVCWQNCPANETECGAGCATSKFQCASTITDELVGVATVAANIATLGTAAPATGEATTGLKLGEETITIGSKTFTSSSKVGKALIKTLRAAGSYAGSAREALQSVKQPGLGEDATLTERIFQARAGTKFKVANTTRKVVSLLYGASAEFKSAYAEDFANQTSPAINKEIDDRFNPDTAAYIKKQWASVQLNEMVSVRDFNITNDVLSALSIADISGVSGLVNSFLHPVCADVIPFPTLSQNYK